MPDWLDDLYESILKTKQDVDKYLDALCGNKHDEDSCMDDVKGLHRICKDRQPPNCAENLQDGIRSHCIKFTHSPACDWITTTAAPAPTHAIITDSPTTKRNLTLILIGGAAAGVALCFCVVIVGFFFFFSSGSSGGNKQNNHNTTSYGDSGTTTRARKHRKKKKKKRGKKAKKRDNTSEASVSIKK